jgi:hypothetical protein
VVEATDNIIVAKVFVTVFDEQNNIIEMGDAVRKEGDWWEFATQTQGPKIRARAGDLARNRTDMVV